MDEIREGLRRKLAECGVAEVDEAALRLAAAFAAHAGTANYLRLVTERHAPYPPHEAEGRAPRRKPARKARAAK